MLLKVYKSRVWILLIMLLPFLGAAQIPGLPAGWGFTQNPTSHVLAIPTTVAFDGIASLQANDWVGAFYDDAGTLKCGGAAQWTGTGNIAVVAFGNDTLEAVKNGFYLNELIQWKVYRTETSVESCAKAYDAANAEFNWVNGALSTVAKFTSDPVVTCPTYADPICVTAAPFDLAGGTPVGGVYAGPGVSNGTFSPAVAGVGIHTITYTYTNSYGCSDFCSFTINVIQCQICQDVNLVTGTQFISTYINPTDVNFKNIMTSVLGCLKVAKNSAGKTLAKVGPNWVNNIGNWINTEGYIVTMNCPSTLTICGTPPQVPCNTPIPVSGTKIVPYLNMASLNASTAFNNIKPNLKIVKNSAGKTLTKVGPNWVNTIGNCNAGEGYLVTMNAADNLVYPCTDEGGASVFNTARQSKVPTTGHFVWPGGNAAENTWTIYLDQTTLNGVDLVAGDEIAIFDGAKIVGVEVLVETPVPGAFNESLIAFKVLGDLTAGYVPGNAFSLKCWDQSAGVEVDVYDIALADPYGEAWTQLVFPAENNLYSIATIHFGGGCTNATANAGDDAAICPADSYQLAGNATNYISLLWTSTGTGVFDDATILNPTYTPSVDDITAGSVQLCLTAEATAPCTNATDCMTLTINPLPVFDCPTYGPYCAGDPAIVFEGEGVYTNVDFVPVTGFDPIAAGNYTFHYTVTNAFGCSASCEFVIVVNDLPVFDCPAYGPFCEGDAAVVFNGAGVYTFNGDVVTGFDPIATGTYTFTYTETNEFGCSASCEFDIVVNPLPVFDCPAYGPFCLGDNAVTFTEGGVFTYEGIVVEGWDPYTVGTFTFTYTETNEFGCSASCNFDIVVNPLPVFDCPAYGPYCEGDAAVTFDGAGVYTFNGEVVTGFDPVAAGTYTFTYTETNAFGCSASCEFDIVVNPLPVFDCPAYGPFCAGDPAFVFPGDGVYRLDGQVVAGFDPSEAGTYSFTFTKINEFGCSASCNFDIVVNPLPVFDCPAYGPFCLGDDAVTFTEGGVFTFEGIVVEGWDPYTVGTFTFTYTETNEFGCSASCEFDIVVNPLPVFDCPAFGPYCEGDAAVVFDGAGVYTFNGEVVTGFDPVAAGTYTFTYTETNEFGCSASCNFDIVVNAPVTPTCTDMVVCENDPVIEFNPGPWETYYYGAVQIESFDPAAYQEGVYVITHMICPDGVCCGSCNFTITVLDAPDLISAVAGNETVDLSWLGIGDTPLKTITGHFPWGGGNAAENTWTIYLDQTQLNGVDLEAGDEIAILDGAKIVGVEILVETPVPGSFNESLIAFKVLGDLTAGFVPGDAITLKCWDASAGVENEAFTVTFADPYGDPSCWTQPVFPSDNDLYSIATIDFTIQQAYVPTFNIYQDGALIASDIEGNNYQVDGLTNGDEYCFTVTQNMEDLSESCHSNVMCATPVGGGCVNPPTANAGADAGICADGSSYQLNGSVTNAVEFFWSTLTGTGDFDNENALDAVYTPSDTDYLLGSVELCLTAVGGPDCQDAVDCLVLTFNPMPEVTCPADFAVCVDAAAFDLTGGLPVGGIYSDIHGNTVSFDPAFEGVGTHEITYTYVDQYGCSGSCTFTITVNPLPTYSYELSATELCYGEEITYTEYFTGTAPWTVEYYWNGVLESFTTSDNPSITTEVLYETSVYEPVIVTDGTGCSSPVDQPSTITVNPLPTYSYELSATDICYGGEITYTEYFTGTAPWTVEYYWNGVLETYTTSDNPSITTEVLYETSIYEPVLVTDGTGCSSPVDQPSTITVHPLPVFDCPAYGPFCEGEEEVVFEGPGVYTFEGEVVTSFDPAVAGTYAFTYTETTEFGCSASCNFEIVVNPLPVFDCPAYGPFCEGDGEVVFDGEGVYTFEGSVVTGFDPETAGTYTFTYTVTNEFGCSASCNFDILVNATPELTEVSLEVTEDGNSWLPVDGTLAEGYTLCINPASAGYGLNIASLASSGDLAVGYNGFFVSTYPANYFDYWNNRGVNAGATAGTWQAWMWEIINGNQPIFYIGYDGTEYMLVDGLKKDFAGQITYLALPGDYPEGDYTFTGQVAGASGCFSDLITVGMTFNSYPVFSQQPQDVSELYGGVAEFTVAAEYADSYQWYGPNGMIDGETGSSLVLIGITLADEGAYYVAVTNECATMNSDVANLDVLPWTQVINLPLKVNGASTYLDLIDNSIADNLAPLGANLQYFSFMQPTQTYVPGGLSFPWTEERGGKLGLKTTWPVSISVVGWPTLGTEVSLPSGWSIMPVWSQGVVNAADVFGPLGANLVVAMGITYASAYWPDKNIYTLQYLVPGRAYLVYLNAPGTVDFNVPIVDAAVTDEQVAINSTSWNDVENTGTMHAIAITTDAFAELQVGDVIGAFNQYGNIAGMVQLESLKNNVFLSVYADNIFTDGNDGFADGDLMTFKVYRNGEVIDATVTFDPTMPNTNIFNHEGVSAINGLKLSATSINVVTSDLSVQIFPNPAKDFVNIQTNFEIRNLKVVNYVGQVVFDRPVDQSNFQINTSNFGPGMYFVQIQSVDGTVITKRLTIN